MASPSPAAPAARAQQQRPVGLFSNLVRRLDGDLLKVS